MYFAFTFWITLVHYTTIPCLEVLHSLYTPRVLYPRYRHSHWSLPVLQYSNNSGFETLRYKVKGRGFSSQWWPLNFSWLNPSGCTVVLRSTEPVTVMSTRNISWGWGRSMLGDNILTIFMYRLSGNMGASRFWNLLAYLSLLFYIEIVCYILVYVAWWLFMLDGDYLILFDVMKVVLTTCFILSR